MPRTREQGLALLQTHRANLAEAKTFEEYQVAHLSYVDLLIAEMEAELAREKAETAYVARWTSVETTTEIQQDDPK